MKKILFGLLTLCLSFSLVACGSSGQKTILVATSPDYPPYETIDDNNKMVGFDIDMTKWLFNYLKKEGKSYTYKWKKMSFDTIVSAVNTKQVDLGIAGFTYDKKRKVLFSDSYNTSSQVAVVKADSSLTSVDELTGKKIGVQLGSTAETAVKEVKEAEVTSVSDAKLMLETLKTGGLDAVILDVAVAKNYETTGQYKILEGSLLEEENYIITNTSNKDLMKDMNKAIQAFKKSDDYLKLKKKWGV